VASVLAEIEARPERSLALQNAYKQQLQWFLQQRQPLKQLKLQQQQYSFASRGSNGSSARSSRSSNS
jgi:hypothetical protein